MHEVCNRAGFAEQDDYADQLGDDARCLVKFGCKGPVVKCNVPARGWINGIGGCPNVGGICMACTMPGFPDKYLPLFDTGVKGKVIAARVALRLRAGAQAAAQPEHEAALRDRARVAPAGGRARERLRAALVAAP